VAVRDVNHDANVIAELDATCMSFPRRAMLPSAHHLGGQGKELFLLRVHSDALAILGTIVQ